MLENTEQKKIRIGILMHGIFYGGATRSLFLLLKSLRYEAFEFIIYTIGCNAEELRDDLLKYAIDLKIVNLKTISVNQIYKESFLKFLINSRISCKTFIDQLNKDNITILHINSTVFPQVPEWIKKYSDIKVIVHLREWLSQKTDCTVQRYMVQKIFKFSDALVAISSNEAELFRGHPNIHTIPNPFDLNALQKSVHNSFRSELNIAKDQVLVAMFSHFSKSKGHLTFLESVNILLSRTKTNPGFKFLIVGFRDKRTWIKTLIKLMVFRKDYTSTILKYLKKKKLEKHVLLIPYTNNVFQILQAVDIVVRPSKSADPWGRDIIEAMAFGKPVIATGTSEFFIKNKITGYLVPPESPEKLAECLNSLILSPDLRQIMGTAGHNIIREMCDLDNFKESIKKVYHDLIK